MPEATREIEEIGRMALRAFGDLVHDRCFEHMSTFLAAQDIVPEMNVSTVDEQQPPLHDEVGDLLPRLLDKTGKSRTRYPHLVSAFGMRKAFIIGQSEGLILVQRQSCLLKFLEAYTNGLEFGEQGWSVYDPVFFGPGHGNIFFANITNICA